MMSAVEAIHLERHLPVNQDLESIGAAFDLNSGRAVGGGDVKGTTFEMADCCEDNRIEK